jgi:hypothetical protein
MRIISTIATTTRTTTAKTMVTVLFLLLAVIFTTSPYSSSSSFVLVVQAQEYHQHADEDPGDSYANTIPDDPMRKIRQQQYEKVLGNPNEQQSLCVEERLLNKECRNEMIARYGDEEDANDTRQPKFIQYVTEKELRKYCLELSHQMSQCKIKGIYHSSLDREHEKDDDSGSGSEEKYDEITNSLGEKIIYGKSPKQIENERLESHERAHKLSQWRWNVGLKGTLIFIILYGMYAVYADTKNGSPLKRVPTAAANKEKEEELKDPTDKKKD